jgi:hypothetical protein
MTSTNIYYVYAYIRAKDSPIAKAGTPYYIGKGCGKRAYVKHKNGTTTPSDKSKIVILESNLTEIGALALERRMIAWWGKKNDKTGILHNKSDGGEGTSGFSYKRSDETKNKLSEIKRTDKYIKIAINNLPKNICGENNGMYGKNHTEKSRNQMKLTRSVRNKANDLKSYSRVKSLEEINKIKASRKPFNRVTRIFDRKEMDIGNFAKWVKLITQRTSPDL